MGAPTNNEYPDYNPKARKRAKKKKRPAHLPPYDKNEALNADAPQPENEQKAKKALSAAPAAAGFGAKKGAGNALLFHAMKKEPAPAAKDDDDDGEDDEG